LTLDKSTIRTPHRRSQEAITTRNKKRHAKLKLKLKQYTITRSITRKWTLKDIKRFLKHHHIPFFRLPEIYNHQLRIQFCNETHQQHADRALPDNAFDDSSYDDWINTRAS
jgi:hypothetical protein